MRDARGFYQQQPVTSRFNLRRLIGAALIAMVLPAALAHAIGETPAGSPGASAAVGAAEAATQENPLAQELKKYPGLLEEFAHFETRLQQELQFPANRSQSRLLPLLPESTAAYAAVPNYGDVVHQALKIFQQELKESAVLREWWTKQMGADGPKLEDGLEKLYQLSQYLGDEIVVSASMSNGAPSPVILAQVKKPGLRAYIAQVVKEVGGPSAQPPQIYSPLELATAKKRGSSSDPLLLLRPDLLVVTFDLPTLKRVNAQLQQAGRKFPVTPFGERMTQGYFGGTGILVGVDLQKLISQVPGARQNQVILERSGFSDLEYLVWEHKDVGGRSISQAEVTFTGPRRGVASWLAAPSFLGGLDFVSPKATLAAAFVLKNPGKILDDIKDLAEAANPGSSAPLAQAEAGLNIRLKEDLLDKLSGEVAFEVEPVPESPLWKAILRSNDADGLRLTLARLLQSAQITATKDEEGGLAYTSVSIPAAKPTEITYAFTDGYLIVAPSRALVKQAVGMHRSGESLAKSSQLRASLPPGHTADASALVYQNFGPFFESTLRQVAPGLELILPQMIPVNKPIVTCAYGEERAVREASTSGTFDLGIVLMTAAIAIPNLMKSRTAANDAGAASTLRTVNVAEITYMTTYPERGFAPDLATLGGSGKVCAGNGGSPEHACLLGGTLGNADCTSREWCTKSGFRYTVAAICEKKLCDSYVVVATPVDASQGGKSFCSTPDAVIRSHSGPPLTSPVSVQECERWAPLQ